MTEVVSVNIAAERSTPKRAVPQITLNQHGIVGDAHAGPGDCQVSLLSLESIERFAGDVHRQFAPGQFAENITVRGLDAQGIALLDRFEIGSAELEVTHIGKTPHGEECSILHEAGRCLMPEQGIFCRVRRVGQVRPGDRIRHIPRILQIRIITLSDRASRGEYEDRSGPLIRTLLEDFFRKTKWRAQIDMCLLPDDAGRLEKQLRADSDAGVDVIVTTGGTGVGPRDFTPDVIASLADKIIPGIMDYIRIEFGRENPNALLSRSVAAVIKRTLVYALPGSVRAVREYMGEILKTMEHLIFTLHALDRH
jgi:molybdenum cofactor synthesis domain-containing protein